MSATKIDSPSTILSPLSESEEMYLVTVARLIENGISGPVPISALAGELEVLPVSVNQMVRHLEDKGWLTYAPYRGIELTEKGQQAALRILRTRRLWEVFLVEKLELSQVEAGDLACRLEHALPGEATERLSAYLGYPNLSPAGKEIPRVKGNALVLNERSLDYLGVNQSAIVTSISANTATRNFLAEQDLAPGCQVILLGVSEAGDMLLRTTSGKVTHLSKELAREIKVRH